MNMLSNIGAYQEIGQTKIYAKHPWREHLQLRPWPHHLMWSARVEQLDRGRLFPGLQGLLSCTCKTQYSHESKTHSHECSGPKLGVTELLISFM